MTREEAGRFWPIIKAYANGKQIEFKDDEGVWLSIKHPDFDSRFDDYRVKKEPVYRPFKDVKECLEEMSKHQPVGWIKSLTGHASLILEVDELGVATKNRISGYAMALKDFVFTDGTPFGIEEED